MQASKFYDNFTVKFYTASNCYRKRLHSPFGRQKKRASVMDRRELETGEWGLRGLYCVFVTLVYLVLNWNLRKEPKLKSVAKIY